MNPSHLVWLFSYSGRLHCTEYRVAIYVSLCSVAFNRPGRIWSNLWTVSIYLYLSGLWLARDFGNPMNLSCLQHCLFIQDPRGGGAWVPFFCVFVDWLFAVAMCKGRLALNNKTMWEIHSFMFSAISWENTEAVSKLGFACPVHARSIIILIERRVRIAGWVRLLMEEAIHIWFQSCRVWWTGFKDGMSPHPVDLLYSFMVHIVTAVGCPGAGMLSIDDVFLLTSVQWISNWQLAGVVSKIWLTRLVRWTFHFPGFLLVIHLQSCFVLREVSQIASD